LKEHSTIYSANEYELDVLNTFCARRVKKKLKTLHKECVSSLALLPPGNFAVFETKYLLEYYTQRAKTFTMY